MSFRENFFFCLNLINDILNEMNSVVVLSDFIFDSFVDDIILFKKSCLFFKN